MSGAHQARSLAEAVIHQLCFYNPSCLGYLVPDTLPVKISGFSAGSAREQLFQAALAFKIGVQTRSLAFASQVDRPLVNNLIPLGDIKTIKLIQILDC